MRPTRTDIPLPPFPPGLPWAGPEPPAAERLTAKGPLLVIFFEAGELNGVQALEHVNAWAAGYADAGLTTVGVHTPRSDLARAPEAFQAAIGRLGLGFPVVSDSEYRVWHAYGTKGWPSVFLWGMGGKLKWFHFGIGGLAETEEAIRVELRGPDAGRELPERIHELHAEEQIEVVKPSDEVFPGGSHDNFWVPGKPGEPLEVEYAGAGAWAALDGTGRVSVSADEGPAHEIELGGPGVYEISSHGTHGVHEIRLDLDGDVRVWSVAFAAGPSA